MAVVAIVDLGPPVVVIGHYTKIIIYFTFDKLSDSDILNPLTKTKIRV